jgi:hypothetical protein
MNIKSDFPILSNYPTLLRFISSFIGYYDGVEYNDMDEEAALEQYSQMLTPFEINNVMNEGSRLLFEGAMPYKEMSKATLRYFESEDSASQWLESLRLIVERTTPK